MREPENQADSLIKGMMQITRIIRIIPAGKRLLVLFVLIAVCTGAYMSHGSILGTTAPAATATSKSCIAPPGPIDADAPIDAALSINVGLNSRELRGDEASVFSDCDPKLAVGERVWVANEGDQFFPTIRVRIARVVDRGANTSQGCMFLSRDATKRLGLFERAPGIKQLKLRRQSPARQQTAKANDGDKLPLQVNINLSK